VSKILLTELWRYPVKSMRGARFEHMHVNARGFEFDRHWMLVDEQGEFLTQRQVARMVLLNTDLNHGALSLSAEGQGSCRVTMREERKAINVNIWGDRCLANTVDNDVDLWLSDFLQQPCRLVEMSAQETRIVDQDYAQPLDQVGFADGFPFLLISQASLDEMNQYLNTAVTMSRFRPNLVVTGCEPFAEDRWRRIRIGDMDFRLPKPCSRCSIPGIDPQTAERDKALLHALAKHRRRDNKIFFGQNALHDSEGELAQNMRVTILETDDD